MIVHILMALSKLAFFSVMYNYKCNVAYHENVMCCAQNVDHLELQMILQLFVLYIFKGFIAMINGMIGGFFSKPWGGKRDKSNKFSWLLLPVECKPHWSDSKVFFIIFIHIIQVDQKK